MTTTEIYQDIADIKQIEYERRKQEAENLQRLKQEREKTKTLKEDSKVEHIQQKPMNRAQTVIEKSEQQLIQSQSPEKGSSAQSKRTTSDKQSTIDADNVTQTSVDNEDLQKQEKQTAKRLQWLKEQESKKYRQIMMQEQEKVKQMKLQEEQRLKKEAIEAAKKQRELQKQEEIQQELEYKKKQVEQKEQKEKKKLEQQQNQLLRQQKLFEEKITAPERNPLDKALDEINYKPQKIDYEGTKVLNTINIKDKTTYDKETQQIRLEDVDIDALINLEGYKMLKLEIEQKQKNETKQKENRSQSPLLAYSPFKQEKRPPKSQKVPETLDSKLEKIKEKQKQYRIQNILSWKKNDTSNQMPVNRVINGKQAQLTDEEVQILKDQNKLLHFVGALQNGLQDPKNAIEIKKVLQKKEERAQTMAAFLRTTDATFTSLEPPRTQTMAPLQIPPDPRKSPVKQVTEITLKAVSDGGIAPRVVCPGRLSRGSRDKVRSPSKKQLLNPLPTYMSYKYIQNVEQSHLKNCNQLLQTIQHEHEVQREKRQTLQIEQLDYKTVSFEELASQQNSHVSNNQENEAEDNQINENYITLQVHYENGNQQQTLKDDVDQAVSEKSISVFPGSQKRQREPKNSPNLPTIQQQREIESEQGA